MLQVARSFCPGGLGGWVSYVKKPLLAPLELTIEADERIARRRQRRRGRSTKPPCAATCRR